MIFSYANPILRLGAEAFADAARDAGVDGVLVLDLPIEEAGEFRTLLASRGIDTILLLSPTTSDSRLRDAARLGSGFLYAISRLGVTGARDRLADGAEEMVRRIRRVSDLPVALGFGISKPEHVREVGRWADAAVVGSALVNVIAEAGVTPESEHTRRGVCAVAEVLTIEELRTRIDVIDEQLVRLLNVRVACAVEVGRLKHEAGLPIYQPDREAQVLGGVRQSPRPNLAGPLTADAVVRIFERIIDEARRAEREASARREDPRAARRGVSAMVVVMKERATEAQIDAVIARLIELGMDVHRSSGATRTVLGVVGAHKVDRS